MTPETKQMVVCRMCKHMVEVDSIDYGGMCYHCTDEIYEAQLEEEQEYEEF